MGEKCVLKPLRYLENFLDLFLCLPGVLSPLLPTSDSISVSLGILLLPLGAGPGPPRSWDPQAQACLYHLSPVVGPVQAWGQPRAPGALPWDA